MREEEKMSRDVYLTMYDKYPLPIFRNIPKSESAHMAAVKVLIDKYELTDPVGDNIIGDFTNTDIQNLYDDLVEKGSASEIGRAYYKKLSDNHDLFFDLLLSSNEKVDTSPIMLSTLILDPCATRIGFTFETL